VKSVRGQTLIRPDVPKIADEFERLRASVYGGFRVIYADPPWRFENRSPKGMQKNAAMHYPCMTVEDICTLPVQILAAPNTSLFMWGVWPLMPHWSTVLTAWGFDYAGLAWEWIKFNPATGKYAFGPGYGTRKNLEPCLLATRGDPKMKFDLPLLGDLAGSAARSVRDFIEEMPGEAIRAPRREHSRKPEEAIARIETLFDGPYIELFSRTTRPGWSSWGNQIDKFAVAA
jgi:N6-adenosine-specific RNA methylase IME4